MCPGTCMEVRAHSQELVLFSSHVGSRVTLGFSGLVARAFAYWIALWPAPGPSSDGDCMITSEKGESS